MKHTEFAVFLAIVLVIYFLINLLIFYKVRQSLSGTGWIKTVVLSVLALSVLSYPVGRFVEASASGWISRWMIYIGSVYFGIMVYAFLMVLLTEAIGLLNRWIHFLPPGTTRNAQRGHQTVALAIVFGTVLYGYVNDRVLRIRTLDLHIDKPSAARQEIHMAAVSDLHLGIMMNRSRLEKIVEKINALNPDIVLLVGDLVDEDAFGNASTELTGILRSIRSVNGVYAVTGNHEYYAGIEKAAAFMKASNIALLQDTVVTTSDGVCLVGRKDATADHMGEGRIPLTVLTRSCDRRLPVVLMNHQPFRLEESEQNGIDFQISGHTHHGQMFPFNLITNAVYEKSWGYLKKGKTQYYVSCGAGTWGPPIRIGSVPEIVEIRLRIGSSSQ